MEITKRNVNGSTNGHGKKTKKMKTMEDDGDLQTNYFESEIAYHSTVTKMKVMFHWNSIWIDGDFLGQCIVE